MATTSNVGTQANRMRMSVSVARSIAVVAAVDFFGFVIFLVGGRNVTHGDDTKRAACKSCATVGMFCCLFVSRWLVVVEYIQRLKHCLRRAPAPLAVVAKLVWHTLRSSSVLAAPFAS
jgi:hypothetical protein